MTILPTRNKRRLEQRDPDPTQQLAQPGPATPLEVQTSSHSHSAVQLQLDASHSHSLSHSQPLHYTGVGQQRINHSNVYSNSLHNHRTDTHARAQGSGEAKWRRSPPMRSSATTSSEEKYVPPQKRSKRSKAKSKHSSAYDYQQTQDNHSTHSKKLASSTTPSSYVAFLPNTTASPLQQSRPILIPPTSNVSSPQISPKMPGGAQEKAGTGRRAPTPENRPNSEDEYQDAPSPGGCNSEDEHVPSQQSQQYTEELEGTFELALKKELGLDIRQMEMDGSCMFRAIADQVYGDQSMHDVVRRHCIDYMAKNVDHFSHYVTEDFNTYLHRKRQLGCHGNHIELQALSEMYNRPIEVYQYSLKPMNIFHGSYRPETVFPIRLSYHKNTHYNSLVDPEKPTIGVGLGLPGFKPRMVEQNLVAEVKLSSENYQLEQTMLNDKLRETDWEITDDAINEQVARESYLQWLQDCQKQKRRVAACTVTGPSCSSGTEETVKHVEKLSITESARQSGGGNHSPKMEREKNRGSHSPKSERNRSSTAESAGACGKSDTAVCGGGQASSSTGLDLSMSSAARPFTDLEPFSVYNYNDNIDESEAIARAIAESQQEYIQHVLKKQ